MYRPQVIVCLLALTLLSSPAFADTSNVSEADQEACTPDVFRLCQAYIPNEAPIVACLEAKRAELSAACHRVMFPPTSAEAMPDSETPSPKTHGRHHHRKHHKP